MNDQPEPTAFGEAWYQTYDEFDVHMATDHESPTGPLAGIRDRVQQVRWFNGRFDQNFKQARERGLK